MILLDIFEQREPYQKAIDALAQRRIEQLEDYIKELKKAQAQIKDVEQRQAIQDRIDVYNKERVDLHLGRTVHEAQPSQQPPAKGLLRGKDLVTPQQRVAGATPAKPGVAGAVKDVVGGIKRFVKGEPDSGPTYEQIQSPGPRAFGVANFQRLVKANMGSYPKTTFEFANQKDNFELNKQGIDLISDYYDGLENDSLKNHFIYRVLPSAEETLKLMKKLGWNPQVQQELPGISTQGELPLSEKKKSKDTDDLQAGDVKVARELQKLRAQYPAARSDVEAVARAEIDSSERSQQQLAAIRGANEKQDTLLKQLVALDQEQGREIDSLDQENNSLEQQLARVQTTNDRLQQTIDQITASKSSVKPQGEPATATQTPAIDLIPDAPADTKPTKAVKPQATISPAIGAMARTIQGFAPPPDTTKKDQVIPDKTSQADSDDEDLVAKQYPKLSAVRPKNVAANVDDFRLVGEHGGGIGPRQHWQSLMRETGRPPMDTINYYFPDINAQSDVEAIRAAIRQIVNNPELSKTSKQRLLGQVGMMVQRNRALIGREWRQYLDRFTESDEHLVEGIKDTAGATAVIACLLTGGSLQGCATAPQQTTAQQVLKTGQDIGRTVQSAKKITRAGVEAEVNQEIKNVMRGMSRPEELNHSNILRIWKRIKGQPPVQPEPQAPEYGPAEPVKRPATEAKEIATRDDFVKERDRLLRMIGLETDPANKQILKSAIRQLESRAEQEGWIAIQQRMVREDTAALAAEDAILKRIFVKHRDLMMEYGPDKITQAAEEVAYNVGDIAHITDEQINEWVGQVESILGARP